MSIKIVYKSEFHVSTVSVPTTSPLSLTQNALSVEIKKLTAKVF